MCVSMPTRMTDAGEGDCAARAAVRVGVIMEKAVLSWRSVGGVVVDIWAGSVGVASGEGRREVSSETVAPRRAAFWVVV